MTYKAVIGKIYTSPHPNADNIQIGHVCGFRVIVDLSAKDGDLFVFFDTDGQLSEAFAKEHDLIRRKDENGNNAGGFFEEKRKVRAQPFRGVKSEGFAVPISYLAFTGYDISQLKEGDQFDELNGIPICNKYFTKATLAQIAQGGKKNALKTAFPQHYDTTQFRYAHLEKGDLVIITEKEHGTSVRYGYVEVEREHSWWRRLLANLFQGLKSTYISTEHVLGTRRGILDKIKGSEYEFIGGYYGSGKPYNLAAKRLHGKLKNGEIIYGELVGYTSNGASLFSHSLSKLPDLVKIYGDQVEYSYGCVKGEARLRVYRITHNGRDLSWFEILARTEALGCEVVSEVQRLVYNGNRDELNAVVETFLEGPSLLDDRHLREGVCIRVENEHGHKVYKEKSWSFKVAEDIAKDNEAYVDIEEIA